MVMEIPETVISTDCVGEVDVKQFKLVCTHYCCDIRKIMQL